MRPFLILRTTIMLIVGGILFLPENSQAQSYSCRSRSSYTYYPSGYYSAGYYGGSYYPSGYYSSSYYSPKEYKEEVRIKEIYIPSYVQIPLYGAYYSPPSQMPNYTPPVSVPSSSGQPATTFNAPTTPSPAPSPTPSYTTPNPSGMPTAPSYSHSGTCDSANKRIDNLELKLGLILRALEDKRDYPHASPRPGTSEGGPPRHKDLPTPERTPVPEKAPQPKPVPPPTPDKGVPDKENTSTISTMDEVERTALEGVNTSCAACHDAKTASLVGKKGKTLGGGFVMVENGRLTPLTDKQWLKVSGMLSIKKMPPEKDQDDKPVKDLTEQQYGALMTMMLRQTRKLVVP